MGIYRTLYRPEAALYLDHLLRLDYESRYARFAGLMTDDAVRKYWSQIDWRCLTILGFFSEGKLRGAAEIRYEPTLFPTSAELAFSVERAFQSSGVGTLLMRRALVFLANRRIGTARVVCLLDNRRMQRLALKHRNFVQGTRGEVFMTLTTPRPNTGSLMAEWLDGCLGWMASSWDLAARWTPSGAALRGAVAPE